MPDLYCPNCHISFEPRARYCSTCGAPLQEMPPIPNPPPVPELNSTSGNILISITWLVGSAVVLCLLGLGCVIVFSYSISAFRAQANPWITANEPYNSHPTLTPNPFDPNDPPNTTPDSNGVQSTDTLTGASTAIVVPSATPRPVGQPFMGKLAPEFTLLDAYNSESVTLSHFTGQPVVVHFWATWCGYCEDEFPYLQEAFENHREAGLVILAVDYEDRRNDVIDYGRDHALTFPLLLDKDGAITDDVYLVNGFPTSFFIYPNGTISFIQIGTMTREEFNQQLNQILSP